MATLTREHVLQTVREWPWEERLELVQQVLQTLQPALTPRRPTLARARGLAATTRPAPTDTEVAQLLAERREEKFG